MRTVTPRTTMLETKKMAKSILFGVFVFLLFTLAFFWSYYVGVQKRNAIEGGVIVEAEIVDVERNTSAVRSSSHLVYEYIDDNGKYYTGWGDSNFQDEDEARSYIGTKIDIYIDGKGNSIAVGKEPGDIGSLVVGIVLIIVTIFMIVKFVSLLKKYKYEKLLYLQKKAAEVEEEHLGIEGGSFLQDLQKYKSDSDNK